MKTRKAQELSYHNQSWMHRCSGSLGGSRSSHSHSVFSQSSHSLMVRFRVCAAIFLASLRVGMSSWYLPLGVSEEMPPFFLIWPQVDGSGAGGGWSSRNGLTMQPMTILNPMVSFAFGVWPHHPWAACQG